MKQYLCHNCAKNQKLLPTLSLTSNLTGSNYQLRKFIKHTVTSATAKSVSVFITKEYKDYLNYAVSASLSGSVEIDNKGRKNIVIYAGKTVGFNYDNGIIKYHEDSIKLVLPEDISKRHLYSINSIPLSIKKCANCGKPVI